ncbi:hypothetical protein SVIOM74S_03963 [Streptomyces violarus]
MREVGLSGAGVGVLEGTGQRVRPGPLQRPHGHRQPAERLPRPAFHGPPRRVAPIPGHVRLDDEGGGGRGPAAQGAAQRRVPDGAGEGGQGGEHRGGQQDGEQGGREEQPMRTQAQQQ